MKTPDAGDTFAQASESLSLAKAAVSARRNDLRTGELWAMCSRMSATAGLLPAVLVLPVPPAGAFITEQVSVDSA